MADHAKVYVHCNHALAFLASNWEYIGTRFPDLQRIFRTIDGVVRQEGWQKYMQEQSADPLRRKNITALMTNMPLGSVSINAPYPTNRGIDIWGLITPPVTVNQGHGALLMHPAWRSYGLVDILRARAFVTHLFNNVRHALEASGIEPPQTLQGVLEASFGVEALRQVTYMRDPPKHACLIDGEMRPMDGDYDLLFWVRLLVGIVPPQFTGARVPFVSDIYVVDVINNPVASARLFVQDEEHKRRPCMTWISTADAWCALSTEMTTLMDVTWGHYENYLTTIRLASIMPKYHSAATFEHYSQKQRVASSAAAAEEDGKSP